MSDGQLAMNTNLVSPGLFLKDSNGDLVKVGPVHVGTTAPNATPGAGGQAGNSKGEQWLDTSSSRYVFKIWDGTAWRTEDGEFVNASGDTMTGALVMDNQQQVRFRETTANGTNFIAIQSPASVAADRTLTLPDVTGTIVSTGDTGTVTSTMILDETILNADINASAAIVDTKLATIATAGKVSNSATTATNANTASAIVARDGSGNFTAGTITAALTGAASSNVLKAGDTMTGVLAVTGSATISSQVNVAARFGANVTSDVLIGSINGNTPFIASQGAYPLQLRTNATTAMTIDGSQRVGIGITTPGRTLTVSSSADTSIQALSTGTGSYVQFNDSANSSYIGTNNGSIVFLNPTIERSRIDSSGRLLVGTSSDSGGALLQVNGNRIRIATANTPASAGATGTTGEIAWDANYIYVCTATNTWKRTAISTW